MAKGIITVKVISEDENLITEHVNRLKRIYDDVEVSNLQKHVGESNFHLFVKITVDKAPPKEQTDVKVKEVQ
jgi:hypothetical protein